jgi:hypothetical protein
MSIGRIFLSPAAPDGGVGSQDHEERPPAHGYEPTREEAMPAFAKSCDYREFVAEREEIDELSENLLEVLIACYRGDAIAGQIRAQP